VLEVQVNRGAFVNRGTGLFTLQLDEGAGEQLEAVFYVPSKDGKYVLPGMEAQISPLSAPREEFGFILGNVTYVSAFPATRAGMMRVLANDVLVQSMSREGAPFAAYAALIPNPAQPGSYRWSSPKGETVKVGSGTPCIVTITVREQRPIELVIPFLREKAGLY
jgi:HlyD family secretion protein